MDKTTKHLYSVTGSDTVKWNKLLKLDKSDSNQNTGKCDRVYLFYVLQWKH